MNALGELLKLEDIALDVDVPDAGALLRRVAAMLAQQSRTPEAEVLEGLEARERLGSTALGHGVAIPHARLVRCGMASIAFVRTRTAIPFGSLDGRPVSLFLGLIVPKQANEKHLKLLAAAATMFSDRGFRESLKASADAAQVLGLFATWPDRSAEDQRARPEG
jgi:PTS system nitrogen regulatory IIA component